MNNDLVKLLFELGDKGTSGYYLSDSEYNYISEMLTDPSFAEDLAELGVSSDLLKDFKKQEIRGIEAYWADSLTIDENELSFLRSQEIEHKKEFLWSYEAIGNGK